MRFYFSVAVLMLYYKISKYFIGCKIEDFHLSLYAIKNYHFLKGPHYRKVILFMYSFFKLD